MFGDIWIGFELKRDVEIIIVNGILMDVKILLLVQSYGESFQSRCEEFEEKEG